MPAKFSYQNSAPETKSARSARAVCAGLRNGSATLAATLAATLDATLAATRAACIAATFTAQQPPSSRPAAAAAAAAQQQQQPQHSSSRSSSRNFAATIGCGGANQKSPGAHNSQIGCRWRVCASGGALLRSKGLSGAELRAPTSRESLHPPLGRRCRSAKPRPQSSFSLPLPGCPRQVVVVVVLAVE